MPTTTVYSVGGTPITMDVRDAPSGQVNISSGGEYSYSGRGTPNLGNQPITPSNLQTPTPFTLPKQTSQNYNSLLSSVQAGLTGILTKSGYTQDTNGQWLPPKAEPTPTPTETSYLDKAKEIMGLYKEPQSQADLYTQAMNETGVRAKREAVQSYTNQLNSITARSQADQLAAQNQSSAEGGTAGILSARTDAISRSAAIQALPVAAQLAAAQGDLQLAESHLDTLFKLKVADAERQTNYWNKIVDMNWDMFKTSEQNRLADIKTQTATNNSRRADAVNNGQTIGMELLRNGQANLAAQIMGLDQPDSMSKTFEQDLMDYNQQVAKISGQYVDPTMALGKVPGGVAGENTYKSELATTGINAVDGLLKIAQSSPGIFGRTASLPIPNFARSSAFRNYSAQLDYLKGNIIPSALTAMREASKTGGALGQVSDREGAWLASSLGALNMNQSPENIVQQLLLVKQHLTNWQNAVEQYGGRQQNIITAPDGTQIIITD